MMRQLYTINNDAELRAAKYTASAFAGLARRSMALAKIEGVVAGGAFTIGALAHSGEDVKISLLMAMLACVSMASKSFCSNGSEVLKREIRRYEGQ